MEKDKIDSKESYRSRTRRGEEVEYGNYDITRLINELSGYQKTLWNRNDEEIKQNLFDRIARNEFHYSEDERMGVRYNMVELYGEELLDLILDFQDEFDVFTEVCERKYNLKFKGNRKNALSYIKDDVSDICKKLKEKYKKMEEMWLEKLKI